jgi:hypothetical protein
MVLIQTLEKPVYGYWDGGAKQVFRWSITPGSTCKGSQLDDPSFKPDRRYVKVGSWGANFWFYVAKSKTDKQTLGNARRKLQAITKIPSTFEYKRGS